MASPDDVAAIFASAWTAGGGARLSTEQVAQLGALWTEARRNHPDLEPREFAMALAELAPGAEGLGSFLGQRGVASSAALAATMARGSVMGTGRAESPGLLGTEDTMAPPLGSAQPRQAPERYRLIRQLGAGAMGVVWEAEDKQLHRRIALKWVTPSAATDRGYRTRLFREARALAQLHHPNVLGVFDAGEVGDEVFLALELIDGTTARAWMDAAKRTPDELLAAWRQAGAGVAAVHAAGLVHRDIKPENVFVAKDGRVVIGDFGLATGALGETLATNLTATGAVVGTPLYMPPEQLTGEPATARGDQFSLCVCIWEALAGARPFDATSIAGLAVKMLKPPAIPPGVDRAVFAVLQRGLATEAKDRWPDVPALLAALEPAVATARKGRGGLVAIAAALAVGAVGAVVLQRLTRGDAGTATVAASGSAAGSAVAAGNAVAAGSAVPAGSAIATGSASAQPVAAAGSAAVPTKPVSSHTTAAHAKHVADAASDDTDPPVASTWRKHYDDSINALQAGNGKLCAQLLADMASWPADASRELQSSEAMLGSCLMAAGDCVGGRAADARFAAKYHLTADDLAKRQAEHDASWCPLDAEPKSAQLPRLLKRIEKLAYARRSCKPLLDFAAANHISLDTVPGNQMMLCLVADGRCDEAREAYHRYVRNGGPPTPASLLPQIDKSFDQVNPSCVRPEDR